MTPKEKAESLLALMYDVDFWDDEDQPIMQHHHARKCALIAVDEIINVIEDNCLEYDDNYWNEVKTEMNKL